MENKGVKGRTRPPVFDPCTQGMMDAGEEIVISGIAGRFPDSRNVKHLGENLMNKVDLVTNDDRRWTMDHLGIPRQLGKVHNIDKFDADFFGVNFKHAHTMDVQARMLMEHAYEAIIDAGINPQRLRGTNTGVFVGACFAETAVTWIFGKPWVRGSGMAGYGRCMFANRISEALDLTGPSYTIDTACSSSMFAMEQAYRAIRDGQCDAALVGGANTCLFPHTSFQFYRLGVLSSEGGCRCFDDGASGYARSEAAGVVFLQKSKDAKRIYATVVHAKTNCDGFKEEGITFPSRVMQAELLTEFYDDCRISPNSITYVEAHGTGTKIGDPEELDAIDSIFCSDRKKPLRIGSVKSNLGHAESASGMCSIAKVVLANELGMIPPNINYDTPRKGVKGLAEGRLQVVTEPSPWEGGNISISSFGFGGANAHVLLRSNPKNKIDGGVPQDELPRLVGVSGRSEEAVDIILQDIINRPVDAEYAKLLHDIHADDISGHPYRGYAVLEKNISPEKRIREIKRCSGLKRPICFIFSGMGSQWPGMGAALLQFPIFLNTIRKCDVVLRPHGVDIYDIITNPNKSTIDNILNSYVGIAAVQIGLVDLLASINIVPDLIIGHSMGELGCAYADGCLTAEQMILAAYSRGLAFTKTKTILGSMAIIGLGYKDIKGVCPSDIEVAYHNSPSSSTISGPVKSIKTFVAHLQANKTFAQEIPCNNVAHHSRYIVNVGPKLHKYLKEIIPEPKQRSPKWISTAVPRSKWSSPETHFSSAEYHTNNLLSPVFFEETLSIIPRNTVTIEIAPHGLLQDILDRSLKSDVTNIAFTQCTEMCHNDKVAAFLQTIGEIFNAGLQPLISNLYPEVQLPVSRGTPMISPLIRWNHSDSWFIPSSQGIEALPSGEKMVEIDLFIEDYEFMAGHIIDGRNLLPATGYLTCVWEILGMMKGCYYTQLPVVFRNVKFLRATTLPKRGPVQLMVTIQKASGMFQIMEGGAAVVTGHIHSTQDPSKEKLYPRIPGNNGEEEMSAKDFYKELRLRGYQYEGLFRGIKSATTTGSQATIAWCNDWVAFMDNMLQIQILGMDSRGLCVPTRIQKLVIDCRMHVEQFRKMPKDTKEFTAYCDKMSNSVTAGGIQIRGLHAGVIPRKKHAGEPVLESYKFIAHKDRAEMSLTDAVHIATHIALENHMTVKVKALEVCEEHDSSITDLMSPIILETLDNLPLVQVDINILTGENKFEADSLPQNISVLNIKKLSGNVNALLLAGRNLLGQPKAELLTKLLLAVKDGGFVLTLESDIANDLITSAKEHKLDINFEKMVNNSMLLLLRKQQKLLEHSAVIEVRNDTFTWVDELKSAMKATIERKSSGTSRILVVSEKQFENGVLGLVNCLRKEPGGELVRGVLIQDEKAPDFSLSDPLYANQLKLDLAINVLRPRNTWGSYRHFKLPPPAPRSCTHAMANQLSRGNMSSFQWFEGPIQPGFTHPDLVHIVYSVLNFRDIMLASGKLAPEVIAKTRLQEECIHGFEYCGVDSAGRRVMGLLASQALTNKAIIDRDLSWYVPENWTLEEAATVPCVYATCYYALYLRGHMKKGDKILIHAGSGGVGQAAITLALHEGCEVFTTIGTSDKRRFIRERFPEIPDNHIGNSRDTSFEKLILEQTNGRGVDIVLNSLSEEKLQASIRCLANGGEFLEIGKFDVANDSQISLTGFRKGIKFHGIFLDNFFDALPERKIVLKTLFQKGLDDKSIKPLTRTVFPKSRVEEAFRYMAGGKHIGKVIINVLDEKNLHDTSIPAIPRYHCLPDRSYIIFGGLGGFGLELADWLVLRGARNLILTSRAGIKNGYQRMRVALWRSYGARVVIVSGKDAADRKECAEILKIATDLAPVDAIFNLAVVLKDALYENQTPDHFEESFKCKAWSTKITDELSRKACPQLRHFVVFSSVSCGRGNAGQTNYGMSNSVMERICERRVAEGYHALAIQWGAIGDVGLVADMLDNNEELVIGGTLQQGITSCLRELHHFLTQNEPIVASMVVAEKRAGGAGAVNIVDAVLNIMSLKDLKAISHQTPLSELGMDSMMGVEIKQTLEREFSIFLTAQDIRNLNFAKLKEMDTQDAAGDGNPITNTIGSEEEVTGLQLLVRLLDEEATQKEVCMKLQSVNDDGKREVFFIPGIEGSGSIFHKLASNMKSTVMCLQLDNTQTIYLTVTEMANVLLPHVLTKIGSRKDFVIVGYSFGSLVAIELVRMLEAEGFAGKLILIDGGPELIKAIKGQFVGSSNEEMETSVLAGIMDMVDPASRKELVTELIRCKSWQEKLDAFIARVPKESSRLSIQYQRSLCTVVYNRLMAIENYDSSGSPPLRSPILLLKPSMPSSKHMSDDCGLSAITREKVETLTIQGNHVTILDNEKAAMAIDDKTLED